MNPDTSVRPKAFVDMYKSLAPDASASAKVPILEHGEPGSDSYVNVIESGVIMEYIEDVWPEEGIQLRPSVAKDARSVRMFNECVSGISPFPLITGANLEGLQKALQGLVKGMRNLDRCLQIYGKDDGDFLLGSAFSVAEVSAAPILWRATLWLKEFRGVDMKQLASDLGCARLRRWMDAVLARPSVINTSYMVTPDGVKKEMPHWFQCDDKLKYTVVDGEVVF